MPNVNTTTGIAYGTIYGNSVPLLMEEIFNNGTDETFEAYKRELIEEMAALLEQHNQRNAKDTARDIVDNYEWDDYPSDENEYSYTDSKGNKFLLGYLGCAPLIWCIETSKIVHARPCSPCVPGAGDLDSPDENGMECYGVPTEYLEEADTIGVDDLAQSEDCERWDGQA